MTVSSVNRFTGVCVPLPPPVVPSPSSLSAKGDSGLVGAIRCDRLSASHSVTSSCRLKGSRFDLKVPETVTKCSPVHRNGLN